jgi:hypothetical protein
MAKQKLKVITLRFYRPDDLDIYHAMEDRGNEIKQGEWLKKQIRRGMSGEEVSGNDQLKEIRQVVDAAIRRALSEYSFTATNTVSSQDDNDINENILRSVGQQLMGDD